MGDVLMHSQSSAKKFGGTPDDYVAIHKFLDQSKLFIADWRHRALLHTTFGISLCEQMFGDLFTRPSDGIQVSTRTLATQHIMEDLGCVPTPEVFLREMPIRPWMNGFNKAQIREMQGKRAVTKEQTAITKEPSPIMDYLRVCEEVSLKSLFDFFSPDKYEGHAPSCDLRVEHESTSCTCGVFAEQNKLGVKVQAVESMGCPFCKKSTNNCDCTGSGLQ